MLSFALLDSPNHSHTNPKIVYVSPFSSEPRKQQSASERDLHDESYAISGDYRLPEASDYTPDEEHIHQVFVDHVNNQHHEEVIPIEDNYGEPAHEDYAVPIHEHYAEPIHEHLDEYAPPTEPPEAPEPQAAPAPALGLLQLLPLFVITVLAVIASTIVGALIG